MTASNIQSAGKIVPLNRKGYGDADLVKEILRGNPMATDALVDRFGPMVHRRVWRILGPDSEHEDVVQQVFLHILHALPKLRDHQALADWVNKLTINVIRKELRRRKYRRIVGLSTELVESTLDTVDAQDKICVARVLKVMGTLDVDLQMVFALRFIEGCDMNEIAKTMGFSEATAKRKVSRARKIFLKKATRDSMLASLVNGKQI